MNEKKCIQIYDGYGKGKTTAAVGAAVRMAGAGGKVVFCQFLKNGKSSELKILRQIEAVQVIESEKSFGFTFQMNEEQKKEAATYYATHFENAVKYANENGADLLVLDELIDAYQNNFVDKEELFALLRGEEHSFEIIITGHDTPEELLKFADYHTRMEAQKHPYEKGIQARKGIEL